MDKRNLASTTVHITPNDPVWTDWKIEDAVKDGYIASGWVYKAVNLIAENAATVPFVVKNAAGEIQYEHPITKLLLKPHPYLSRTQFYELLYQWIELAGNSYFAILEDSRTIQELWPISPDKLSPVESKDNSAFVAGYQEINTGKISTDFTTDNIIHIALTNPQNPVIGISPLKAAARAVDGDVSQQKWNVSATQNRGVVEGVFTFKDTLDKKESDSIMQRIMKKFSGSSNARKPLVLGSEAKYTRMSLTAAEMDFLESRKFNRDEIFVIFGVPPQLGGSEESATYNNFSTAMRIFWETKLLHRLKLVATQFSMSMEKYLGEGYYIDYDTSNVSALSEGEDDKAETAGKYYAIGIPVKQINDKFELGFEEYQGWELPFNGLKQNPSVTEEKRSLVLIPTEKRSAEDENKKRRKLADGPATDAYIDILNRQGEAVYAALEKNEDPIPSVKSFRKEMNSLATNIMVGVASQFAETVVVDSRGQPLNFQRRGELEDELIDEFLSEEQIILNEVTDLEETTIKNILEQVRNASEKGFNYEELRKALEDTGMFSPERANRIARTQVGTASSIGQFSSAKVAGADFKTWETAGTETRPAHVNRAGEEVGIDDRFSPQISSIGPRFPLDPQISASDRVNCDCFMTFRVE